MHLYEALKLNACVCFSWQRSEARAWSPKSVTKCVLVLTDAEARHLPTKCRPFKSARMAHSMDTRHGQRTQLLKLPGAHACIANIMQVNTYRLPHLLVQSSLRWTKCSRDSNAKQRTCEGRVYRSTLYTDTQICVSIEIISELR